jgi:thiol-disulfide isomerase/thioredoxin
LKKKDIKQTLTSLLGCLSFKSPKFHYFCTDFYKPITFSFASIKKMKKLLLLLLLPVALFSQSKTAVLHCKYVTCAGVENLNIYSFEGLAMRPIGKATRQPDSSFIFEIPKGPSVFYAVGANETAVSTVILGQEDKVVFWGNCQKGNKSRAFGSPINTAYEKTLKRADDYRNSDEMVKVNWMEAVNSGKTTESDALMAKMLATDKGKSAYLDSLKKLNPLFANIASLMIQPNYQIAGKSKYTTEGEFWAKEYFKYADFSKAEYNEIPDLMEAFRLYALRLASYQAPVTQQKEWTDAQLAKFNPNSKAYRMAISGLIAGYKLLQSPNYTEYVNRYVAEFKNNNFGEVQALEMELAKSRVYTPGMVAPDLVGDTPEGTKISLSQLRGKYVMIDFWASWCGPCRKENPNVKANYEKYASKGFEILGVSLDRDKQAWVNAIQADGLPWKHISDLKGWQSDLSAIYQVSSIPQTVLLDKSGKIIQRNLRGEQLGEKLKELFGE